MTAAERPGEALGERSAQGAAGATAVGCRRAGGSQRIPRPTAWCVVPTPAPAPQHGRLDTDAIAARLAVMPPSRPAQLDADSRRSAVLVLLADGEDGQASVLLTRRSHLLRSHAGEISFPGGRLDPGELAAAGALREADEEVGLDPAAVEIIGELDHVALAVSRSYVVPIVGRMRVRPVLAPSSTGEVERVLWVPLAELLRADTFRVERWGTPPTSRLLYFFELDDETIWGATAFMLFDLLRLLATPPG